MRFAHSASLLALVGSLAWAAPDLLTQRITFDGLGPLRIGMSETDLLAAGVGLEPGSGADAACAVRALAGHPDLRVMLEAGRVTRLDVYDDRVRTLSGIGIGASEEQVLVTYHRRIEILPHKYVADGHYLVVHNRQGGRAVVFETDGVMVTHFRTGLLPAVLQAEGCG